MAAPPSREARAMIVIAFLTMETSFNVFRDIEIAARAGSFFSEQRSLASSSGLHRLLDLDRCDEGIAYRERGRNSQRTDRASLADHTGTTSGLFLGNLLIVASLTFRCWATIAGGVRVTQSDRETSAK